MIVSRETAEHYVWGSACDGWVLAPGPDRLVIEERMPAGTAETRHVHAKARQVFYVLAGVLTIDVAMQSHRLQPMQGIEVAPGVPHQARNASSEEVRFLVISSPTTRGDRVDLVS